MDAEDNIARPANHGAAGKRDVTFVDMDAVDVDADPKLDGGAMSRVDLDAIRAGKLDLGTVG